MIDKGVSRVILGTKAFKDPGFIKELVKEFGEKISVSIDAVGKGVVAAGWGDNVSKTASKVAKEMIECGVSTLIFTNVTRDGTLEGVEKEWAGDMLDAAGEANVIIAGGVSTLDDIKMLAGLNKKNLYGVITGKAIYEGALDLGEAIEYLKARGDE